MIRWCKSTSEQSSSDSVVSLKGEPRDQVLIHALIGGAGGAKGLNLGPKDLDEMSVEVAKFATNASGATSLAK